MNDERKLQAEAERGEKAETLLADPLILGALEACKAKAYEMFFAAQNPTEAMRARDYLSAVGEFTKDIQDHIVTGKFARQSLKDMAALAARKVVRGFRGRSAA